jgi:type VI secretion system protein ImpA
MEPNSSLDFEVLLAPIKGADPAGEDRWFSVREKLDLARKEIRPESFAPDDPRRPSEPKRADWSFIEREATRLLVEETKDLRLAPRLTEALSKSRGFSGLRDGLKLMRLMVETCWDRIKPALDEDGDLGNRAAPFHWLGDENGGAFFTNTIRTLPLVGDGVQGEYGWIHFNGPKDTDLKFGKANVEADQKNAEKALAATPAEKCHADLADLIQCGEELGQLEKVLDAKMGEQAPALNGLRDALQDCLVLSQSIVKRKGPIVGPGGVTPPVKGTGTGTDAGTGRAGSSGDAAPPEKPAAPTRADVYQRLAEAAAMLQQMEPHSPIPYLIRRAVDLGAMPFPLLMKALISDAKALDEMNRGLGIKEPEKEKAEKEKK